MIVLGIDTSAVTCSAALCDNGRILAEYSLTQGPTHSQTLLPAIRDILNQVNLTMSQVDGIAVSVGPGSFTGLRIGISTVKGLAFSTGIPCIPVSTLEALAMNAAAFEGALVCPLMDARRGEFYSAWYRIENGRPRALVADRAASGDVIAKELCSYQANEGERILLLGDGAGKFSSLYPDLACFLAPTDLIYQKGSSVALLGTILYQNQKAVEPQALSPRYLRLPQAEREWLKKNNNE